jgi:uncharacterized phage protein (TIGR02216 family)
MSQNFGEAAVRLSSAASLLLNWRPHEFWTATPAELAAALNIGAGGSEPPAAAVIEALRQRFPDEKG